VSRVYGNRALLNLPGQQTIAAIVAELENLNGYWCATLQLSDCDRKVSFSLPDPSNCSDAEFENAMYKLDTIVNSVKELQRGMRSVWRRS
jgi:hypothetical protein